LAALVGVERKYFDLEGINFKFLKGIIGIGGIYDIELLGLNPFARYSFFWTIFGFKQENWRLASPIHPIHEEVPPFLLVNSRWDYIHKIHTDKFQQHLNAHNVSTDVFTVQKPLILFNLLGKPGPLRDKVEQFIESKS